MEGFNLLIAVFYVDVVDGVSKITARSWWTSLVFLALENNHVIQRGKILLEELVNFYSPLLGYLKQNSSMSQSIREIRVSMFWV